MNKSKTRNKLFISCMIYMCVFVVCFVAALQVLTNIAFFEAYAESEIKELQEVYGTYTEFRGYFEESIELFASSEHIREDIDDVLGAMIGLGDEQKQQKAVELAEKYYSYTENIDIYIVDEKNIIRLFSQSDTAYASVKKRIENGSLEFVRDSDVFVFLSEYGYYEENNTYKNNHTIVQKINSMENIYVIGVPRYDEIFEFCPNELVIYSKYDHELLRLNTESIDDKVPAENIIRGKSYKSYGLGKNKRIVCYYSDEDERGEYCLGTVKDFDFSYRYYIYICIAVFFVLVGIGMWNWAIRVTKPLDFFLMWIKLVKDKDTADDTNQTKMPKEKYLLQNNIMMFFSFCVIPIVLAGGIQWYTENQILNNYVEERYIESAEFYSEILDEKFRLMKMPISMMAEDERIVYFLQNNGDIKGHEIHDSIDEYMHEYSKLLSPHSEVVTIYSADGEAIISSANDYEADRYMKYRVNVGEDYKWSFAEGLDKFILHHKIYNDAGEVIGYCKLELNDPDLHAHMPYNRKYLYSCYIYKYTDKIYNLVSSPTLSDEKIIDMIRSNEENEFAKSIVIEEAGINYFYIVKERVFFDKIWTTYVIAFMNIVFFLIIAMIFAASILTRSTLNPIIHISNVLYEDSPNVPMSTLLLGKEEFTLIVNRVKTLSEQVNTYAKEQKLLEAERIEHEKRRKDAEILTLQTQINPHFMYNIFSSIAVLIKTGQTEKASKMVMLTGNLMRMGLYRGHVMIPLKEELDHVQQYISIQQIRYNNCMEISIDIDESLMHLKVVKFILQPIVENAIEHNVGYLDDRILKIDINAVIENGTLKISIIDNGRGMEDADIIRLQESINNFDMSNHLGLANINERIKLNCGNEYGVILSGNEKNGIKVELVLPIVVEKEE